MESNCYQVEVLHYLNPHLIWVEVVKNCKSLEDEFFFEQIGVYGLLPLNTTIDFEVQNLKTQRCDFWVPATTLMMKKLFSEAESIWFSPTHIDKRSSIFDSNIHKYGEIYIKRPNGKVKKLSKALRKSEFALQNVSLFHQELSLGNLKTQLSIIETNVVVKEIKKYSKKKDTPKNNWERSVRKQTAVFHSGQNLESTLTSQNIENHNSVTRNFSKDEMAAILKKKFKDFNLCKDIGETPIGRGLKDEEIVEEDNRKVLTTILDENIMATSQSLVSKEEKKEHRSFDEDIKILKHEIKNKTTKYIEEKKTINSPMLENTKNSSLHEISNKCRRKYDLEKDEFQAAEKNPVLPNRKLNRDVHKNTLIAFGPPGFDKSKLFIRPFTKEQLISQQIVEQKQDLENKMVIDQDFQKKKDIDNMFSDVDSEVNIEIENIHILKDIKKDLKVVIEKITKDINSFKQETPGRSENSSLSDEQCTPTSGSKFLQRRLHLQKQKLTKNVDSSLSSGSDTTTSVKDPSLSLGDSKPSPKTVDSDDENIDELLCRINLANTNLQQETIIPPKIEPNTAEIIVNDPDVKNYANPFKNIDPSILFFVDKLVSPVLMVHNKMNKRIEPCLDLRDINFNSHIHITLKNMNVEQPMSIQKISWFTILRGYSLFMISPLYSGKTLGYVPAVCRLVSDFDVEIINSVGPMCIIICATAESVTEVEKLCRMFLGIHERVFSCYAGMDELKIMTSLLNGCDLFICTPCSLVRLLQNTNFGIDLRRLSILVLDDCERLTEVYSNEIKFFNSKIKEMLKNRTNKELKVQYILASRIWCDFMEPIAKKAPNSVICIGAFQECVLYSKANTTVDFVKSENKVNIVLDFLKQIDGSKKTVIACRTDEEVVTLEKVLTNNRYIVFACNSTMNIEDLYNLNIAWEDYHEPVTGPILVCCDDNLAHLNVTDAHHLVHYALPNLFSVFCKRFSTLNENYASIFRSNNEQVKIKILLEQSNLEQLPKILNFIKRCTYDGPTSLNDIAAKILVEKDIKHAANLVPICDNLLSFGECPDFWNCKKRHSVLKEFDEPKAGIPIEGFVTFKILHCHTAVLYSARLLSNVVQGQVVKYSQTYSTLSLKMGRYFSRESNRKLLGIPKIGDICAVIIKQNLAVRCQVIKIISYYPKGNPNHVLIKLIDEEKWETTRDINLYYLPDELKSIQTHVVQLRLANIQPRDRDITFSSLARDHIQRIIVNDENLYMRGKIALTVGNCVFIDSLEACQDLSTLNETVIRHDLKAELLEMHAIKNPMHISTLLKICHNANINIKQEKQDIELENVCKVERRHRGSWAHLEENGLSPVFFASAENPGHFFVRLVKFEKRVNILFKDIQQYFAQTTRTPVSLVKKGDFVLAKFPYDCSYERARIDDIIDAVKVKCFFVDQGDWKVVLTQDIYDIPDTFVTRLPFQAIECRLIGVKPLGEYWTEFSKNWFYDQCYENEAGNFKVLYVKCFTKEVAKSTESHKYGVAIVDTNSYMDIIINNLMIDANLAQANENESMYINNLDIAEESLIQNDSDKESENGQKNPLQIETTKIFKSGNSIANALFMNQPLRSVPLVTSEDELSDDFEKWDVSGSENLMCMFNPRIGETVNPNVISNVVDNLTIIEENKISNDSLNSDTNSLSQESGYVMLPLPQKAERELDSDEISSSELTQTSEDTNKQKFNLIAKMDELRKPTLIWRQNKLSVSVKIQLIGVETYDLILTERSLKFSTYCNDTNYGFEFELYGVIDIKNSLHSNKSQYILVTLIKVLKKNWYSLTKDACLKKWIVYDVDSIDTSSDEESAVDNSVMRTLTKMDNLESDSDNEGFRDDSIFNYNRH